MSRELFGHVAQVEVGSIRFPFFGGPEGGGLSMSFEVEKGRSGASNTAKITLANLNASDKSAIQGADRETVVSLRAGYRGADGNEDPPQIFTGSLFHAESERAGPDVTTTIEARDGGRQMRRARIAQSFAAGASVETAILACADALGVGAGNVRDAAVGAQLESTGSREFSEGTVLDGWAAAELSELTRSVGLTWVIQSGQLMLRRRGEAMQGTAVLLREGTGLLDAKRAGKAHRDAILVTAMLIPDVWPGRRVRVEYEDIEGTYRVTKTRETGQTDGDEWTLEAECVPLLAFGGAN